jgi:hypothetical protein
MKREIEPNVVYHDKTVKDQWGDWIGGTWIGKDNAEVLATHFEKLGFKRKGCSELGKWMNATISSDKASQSVLVFAQDVAPYEVLDDDSPSALIRQYLDDGGTVLWMGDIPFFRRTKPKGNHFEVDEFVGGQFPYISILGVIPISMLVASRFAITHDGRKFGLKTSWASLRPIIFPQQVETNWTRVVDKIFMPQRFFELACVYGVGRPSIQPFIRKGQIRKLLEYFGANSITLGGVQTSIDEKQAKDKSPIEFGVKYASAWIKTFNPNLRGTGFIRIWDYSPRVFTKSMLDEVSRLLDDYHKVR